MHPASRDGFYGRLIALGSSCRVARLPAPSQVEGPAPSENEGRLEEEAMKRAFCIALFVFAVAGAAIVAAQTNGNKPAPLDSTRGGQAPIFEVDPFWPKPLPNHWVM